MGDKNIRLIFRSGYWGKKLFWEKFSDPINMSHFSDKSTASEYNSNAGVIHIYYAIYVIAGLTNPNKIKANHVI